MPALGLGLPLIAALSDAFELRGSAGQGTEVRMTFHYARDGDPADENPVQGTVGDGRALGPGRARASRPTRQLAALDAGPRAPATLVGEGLCSARLHISAEPAARPAGR